MALLGSLPTIKSQLQDSPVLGAIWAYLDHVLQADSAAQKRILGLAVGTTERVDLPDGAFALEQVYAAKAHDASLFESHRSYVDIQVVVRGEELMEWVDIEELTVQEDLLAQRDLLFYQPHPGVSTFRVRSGQAAVFFPQDGHRPSLRVGNDATVVHKTVVKVPVALLGGPR